MGREELAGEGFHAFGKGYKGFRIERRGSREERGS